MRNVKRTPLHNAEGVLARARPEERKEDDEQEGFHMQSAAKRPPKISEDPYLRLYYHTVIIQFCQCMLF
jgi:hypothetical protein